MSLSQDPAALDRARGCLAGQLAGDSLGSLVEFKSPGYISRRYPYGVREMEYSVVWRTIAGQPTDDSEMALSLARGILRRGGYDQDAAREGYVRWAESDPFDIGNTVASALLFNELKHDSQANGAMMRISPLAIFGAARSDTEVEEWARLDAEITHPNRVCVQANRLYAAAISRAVRTGCGADALYESIRKRADAMGAESTLADAIRAAQSAPPASYGPPTAGWVLVAFQNALWQLLHADSVEDALADTISRGGDTDTNAAICGALLGAVRGVSAMPYHWIRTLQKCRPGFGREGVINPRPAEYWPWDFVELADALLNGHYPPPPEKPVQFCYWVIPGKLLAGEYPRNLDDESSPAKIRALTDAGIASFIDLTERGEHGLKPYSHLLGETTERRRFPIRDLDIPGSPDQTKQILDQIDANMADGKPTYVHCWGGIGRTGVIIGCWLARHGDGGQAALDELRRLWTNNPKSAWTASPQMPAQFRYITEWNEEKE